MAQSFGDTGVFSWTPGLNLTEADHSAKEGISSLPYNFSLSNTWGLPNSNTSISTDVSNQLSSLFASSLWGAPSSTGSDPSDSTTVITSTSANVGTNNVWQAPIFSSTTSSDSNTMIFSPYANTPRSVYGATPTPRSPLMTTHAQTQALEMLPVNTSSPSGWPHTTHSISVNTPMGTSSQTETAMPSPLLNTWPVTTSTSGVGEGSPNSGKQDSAAFTKTHLSRGNSLATNQSKTMANGANGNIASADMERMMAKINSTDGWNACYVDQKTAWLEDEQNTRQRAAAESNVWANEPPNGTGLWEKHYEAIGERIARWNPSAAPPSLSWEASPTTPGTTAPSTLPSWPRSTGLNSPGGGGMNPSSSVSSSHWHDPSPSFHSDTPKEKITSPMDHDVYRVGRGGEQQTRAMALNRLKSLGYSTEVATNALISNNMDTERALNFLRSNSMNSASSVNQVSNSNTLRFNQPQSISLSQRMPPTSPITANNTKQMLDSQHALQALATQENQIKKAIAGIQQEIQRVTILSNGSGNLTSDQKLRFSQLEQHYQYFIESLQTIRQKQQQLNLNLQSRNNRLLGNMNSNVQRSGNNTFGTNVDLTAMQMADMRINSFMPGQVNTNGTDLNDGAIGSQWSNLKEDGLFSSNNLMSRPLFGGKNELFEEGFFPNDGLSGIGGRRRQPEFSAFTEPSVNPSQLPSHLSLSNQGQNYNAAPKSTSSHWVIVRNMPVHIKPETLRLHLMHNNIIVLHFQPHVIAHWILIGLANSEDTKRTVNLLQQCLPLTCTVDHVTEQEVLMKMKELEHLANRFGTGSGTGFRLSGSAGGGGGSGGGGGLPYNFNSGMGNSASNNPYGTASTPTGNNGPWPLPMSGNDFSSFPGSDQQTQQHLHSHQLSLSSMSMQQNAAMFSLLQRSQPPLTNNNVGGNNPTNDPFMLMNLAANRSNTGAPTSGHY